LSSTGPTLPRFGTDLWPPGQRPVPKHARHCYRPQLTMLPCADRQPTTCTACQPYPPRGFVEMVKLLCHHSASALRPLLLRRVITETPSHAAVLHTSCHCRVPLDRHCGWCRGLENDAAGLFSPPPRAPHDDSRHRPQFGSATTPTSFARAPMSHPKISISECELFSKRNSNFLKDFGYFHLK
jgi:hypothetical protein